MDVKHLQRILIVGAGSSGLAAARLAADQGVAVNLTDSGQESDLSALLPDLPSSTRTFFGSHPEECLANVDMVVVSPGVAPTIDLLESARHQRLPVVSEPEYAWLHRPDAPLAAITGSNGKSTVTALTAAMLCQSGMSAVAGGNLGPPASDLVLSGEWKIWVLEISSFQAELLTAMAPQVGLFLNLSQDHLERHPDVTAYRDAKRQLFAFQTASQQTILNLDDLIVRTTPTQAQCIGFSLEHPCEAWLSGSQLTLNGQHLIDQSEIALTGLHNVANSLAAALAATALGARRSAIVEALKTFRGLEHRHAMVTTCGGVRWVDDSKATNVGAAAAALTGYEPKTVHLILGGLAKGQDFSQLAPEVARAATRVYLIGADRSEIAAALGDTVPAEDCVTLEEAVRRARTNAQPGETILLAPARASCDPLSSYGARGRRAAELAAAGQEAAPCP